MLRCSRARHAHNTAEESRSRVDKRVQWGDQGKRQKISAERWPFREIEILDSTAEIPYSSITQAHVEVGRHLNQPYNIVAIKATVNHDWNYRKTCVVLKSSALIIELEKVPPSFFLSVKPTVRFRFSRNYVPCWHALFCLNSTCD